MKYLFFFLILIISLSSFSQNNPEVKIHTDKAGLARLGQLGLPADEGFFDKSTLHTVISEEMLSKIRNAGFVVDVLKADYPSYVTRRNLEDADQFRIINQKIKNKAPMTGNYPVPVNFELGSMGGYYTLQEVMSELDSMHLLYPALVTQKQVCTSMQTWDGNQLYYVRITNLGITQPKPKILYNALTHAREPMGMQQLMFYMWYLLENYDTSAEVKYLVDNLDMYFIPVMNPDGYEYNRSSNPNGGGQWRKNRRDNGGTYGVDLNRNFGYMWGYDDIGSSPFPIDETYRGPSAFSEPETQVVRDFLVSNNMVTSFNYHTFSDLFLFPWCYTTQYPADSLLEVTWANIATRDSRYLTGLPGAILYNTNGDIMDWLYGDDSKPKVITFTAETGNNNDGFWPPVNRILPLCQENMYQNLMMAHLTFKYAEAKDVSNAILEEKEGYLSFDFERYGLEPGGTYTVSIEPLDPAVMTAGDPKVYTDPAQFSVIHDSISYSLAADVPVGTAFSYLLKCNNGLYTFTDTITKWYGHEITVFSDSCGSMAHWFGPPWVTTPFAYHSPGGSITDSPSGVYPNNANSSVTTSEKIDLRDSPVAVLSFWTKFELEDTYDYVQVKVSDSNGTSFVPQKGRYTRNGSGNEDHGKPVYDGYQYSWVNEQIVLTDFVNNDIKLRFTLKSDGGTRDDGYYFDDVQVKIIDMTVTGTGLTVSNSFLSEPIPNPASEKAKISYRFNDHGTKIFRLSDVNGVTIFEQLLYENTGMINLPVTRLKSGIYFYRITGGDASSSVKKMIVVH